jgi:signal peptide peptidase SppA
MPDPQNPLSLIEDVTTRTVVMAGPDADHYPSCAASHLGPWLIEPDYLRQVMASLAAGIYVLPRGVRPEVEPRASDGGDEGGGRDVAYHLTSDGIAQIGLAGPLEKGKSKFGTSTVRVRQAVRQAVRDPLVKGIMLLIDSPGGSSSGTAELAADVASAAQAKPVHAHVEDLGASAAYWIGSQSARFSATPTSLVGSIGTVAVVQDSSGQLAKDGVKVHVIATGPYKGAFTPGSEVSKEQLAYLQEYVDGLNEHFLAGVSAGRKMPMEQVRKAADGRIHLAEQARRMGLLDAVEGQDAAMQALRSEIASRVAAPGRAKSETEVPMPKPETTPPAAEAAKQPEAPSAATTPGAPVAAVVAEAAPTPTPAPVVVTPDPRAECKRFIDAFGTIGATWYAEGKTFDEAQALHTQAIAAERDRLVVENAALKAAPVPAGAPAPLSGSAVAGPAKVKHEPSGIEGTLLAVFAGAKRN